MTATDEILMELSNLDALPGQEAQVQRALQDTIKGASTKDAFGNLYFGDLPQKRRSFRRYRGDAAQNQP